MKVFREECAQTGDTCCGGVAGMPWCPATLRSCRGVHMCVALAASG